VCTGFIEVCVAFAMSSLLSLEMDAGDFPS
jgi:hypothetical protein